MKALMSEVLCTCCDLSYAQDKIVLKNGTLDVEVIENSGLIFEFIYSKKELVNEKSKNEISYIIYASGRKEVCNQIFQVPVVKSMNGWEKFVTTHLASDIEGLTRMDEIAATPGREGALAFRQGYKGADYLRKPNILP